MNNNFQKRKLKTEVTSNTKKPKLTKETKEEKPSTSIEEHSPLWEDYQLLAEQQDIDVNVSQNIIDLFKNECTIPFIARYRKAETKNMDPERLRDVKECYENIQGLKTKIRTVLKNVAKLDALDDRLKKKILSSRTLEELEHIVRISCYFC